jgi:hypothetical protein
MPIPLRVEWLDHAAQPRRHDLSIMAAAPFALAQTGKRRFSSRGRHHISEGQTTTMNSAEISRC